MALPPEGTKIIQSFSQTSLVVPDNIITSHTDALSFGAGGIPGTAEYLGLYPLDDNPGGPDYDVWWTTTFNNFFFNGNSSASLNDTTVQFGHRYIQTIPYGGWRENYDDPLLFEWLTTGRWFWANIGDPTPGVGSVDQIGINYPEDQSITATDTPIVEPTYFPGQIISVTEI